MNKDVKSFEEKLENLGIYEWNRFEIEEVKDLFQHHLKNNPSIFTDEKHLKKILEDYLWSDVEILEFVLEFLYSHFPEIFSMKLFDDETILENFFSLKDKFVISSEIVPLCPIYPSEILMFTKFTLKHFPNFFKENDYFGDIDLISTREWTNLILENS